MANFFYIYEDLGSNRRLKGMYVTQDKADTEAAVDTSLTANQGAVDIPDNVSVGWIWDTTKSEWRETDFGDLSELGQKKSAAQAHHNQLLAWAEGVAAVAHEKPQIDVQRAYQFLAMAHWANYVVAHMTDINLAQFIAWTQAASTGSADLTDVQSYFESAHALEEDNHIRPRLALGLNPRTAVRVELDMTQRTNSAIGEDGFFEGVTTIDLTSIYLGNGAWISELTS